MNGDTLALVGLLGLAAYLASRSAGASSVFTSSGLVLPGYDGSDGYVINLSDGTDAWPSEPQRDVGAPWTQPATNEPDPYASAYDYELGGDTMTTPSDAGNMSAMLALIRAVEPGPGGYYAIAGAPGVAFTDTREHPFILDPARLRPAGTTASGAYQMVVGTWRMARDALGLKDFTPASQDAAAAWIIQYKRPAAYPLVMAGNFSGALAALANEWEAFKKMLAGTYPITLARAQEIYESNGGNVA